MSSRIGIRLDVGCVGFVQSECVAVASYYRFGGVLVACAKRGWIGGRIEGEESDGANVHKMYFGTLSGVICLHRRN
jgi:hypothetical protein